MDHDLYIHRNNNQATMVISRGILLVGCPNMVKKAVFRLLKVNSHLLKAIRTLKPCNSDATAAWLMPTDDLIDLFDKFTARNCMWMLMNRLKLFELDDCR